MTYEMDGYRESASAPNAGTDARTVGAPLRDMGANGIKILLSWTPFDEERPNDEKRALIERIGHECDALGMPFFLEPVGYDPGGLDGEVRYARAKPEIVIRTMEEFSKDVYRVDVLKVEFPINAAFVEGSAVYSGQRAYTRSEALEFYRQAEAATRLPYIYLSAGVSTAHFTGIIASRCGGGRSNSRACSAGGRPGRRGFRCTRMKGSLLRDVARKQRSPKY